MILFMVGSFLVGDNNNNGSSCKILSHLGFFFHDPSNMTTKGLSTFAAGLSKCLSAMGETKTCQPLQRREGMCARGRNLGQNNPAQSPQSLLSATREHGNRRGEEPSATARGDTRWRPGEQVLRPPPGHRPGPCAGLSSPSPDTEAGLARHGTTRNYCLRNVVST